MPLKDSDENGNNKYTNNSDPEQTAPLHCLFGPLWKKTTVVITLEFKQSGLTVQVDVDRMANSSHLYKTALVQ